MMPQKNPQCSAMDEFEHDLPAARCHVDRSTEGAGGGRKKADSSQRNGETASSSPESGSLNGDGKRSGKSRRRRKRASNPESRPEGKTEGKVKDEKKPDRGARQPADPCAVLLGLQSECAYVWFERSIYEKAESRYQCWLAHSSNGTTQRTGSIRAPINHPTTLPFTSPPPSRPASSQPQAERRFAEESPQPSVPNSLNLPSPPSQPVTPATPDEGYQSQAPTPATPVQRAASAPAARQPINGLPRIPVELLRDVWLEKPLYDRAEAAFYQNLYGSNSSKRANSPTTSRTSDHPQRLVEEEEEQEEDECATEEKRVVPQGKAEVFHALHPIQEEEEPAEAIEEEDAPVAGVSYFLHPDSERVWLDRWRYDAAESRFHHRCVGEAVRVEGARGPAAGASSVASTSPLRDKYDSALENGATPSI